MFVETCLIGRNFLCLATQMKLYINKRNLTKWSMSVHFAHLLCFTAATRSGPENMENKLSPLAEEVSSLELAESP